MSATGGIVTSMNTSELRIRDLAGIIRTTLRERGDAASIATRVAGLVRASGPTPALLTPRQRQGAPERPTGHLLHAEDGFSMLALVWRPGQQTRIHDHRCWCMVYVLQGSEQETRYHDHGGFLTETTTTRNPVGSVSALAPPGDIHRIRNDTHHVTISLHVYGIDLRVAGSSARRIYDAPVQPTSEPRPLASQ
ncbi:MAG TPA: cysteine dioxygenase family protein [Pseudonocardiaceae bacterium]|nr:cysteine dioxygenase family protein [Pseudonocardiaceae bacterium]